MRIAVLGDVGQKQYHVGDEAMAHAAVQELARRGLDDVVVLSHDAAQTEDRYRTKSQLRPVWPWNAFERHQMLEILLETDGMPREGQADRLWAEAIDALEGCDALLLAGGGNLTSQYGGLLAERLATVHFAKVRGLPVAVCGQTVGPVLTGRDREHLARVLQGTALLGAREGHTAALLEELGVASTPVLDDASFLNVAGELPEIPWSEGGYLAVTLAPGSGAMPYEEYLRTMAGLLRHAHRVTGLPLLFLPHVWTPGEQDGDVEVHLDVMRLLDGVPSHQVREADTLQTAALTTRAALVFSTRYHPVIFALGAGVPALPLAVDFYGEVRLGGALKNWGTGALLRSLRELGDTDDDGAGIPLPPTAGAAWVSAVWAERESLRAHLEGARGPLKAHQDAWWDGVAAAIGGHPHEPQSVRLPEIAGWEFALGRGSSALATRLNGGNEEAIGNLFQDIDWLRGELVQAHDELARVRTESELLRAAAGKWDRLSRNPVRAVLGSLRNRLPGNG